MLAVFVSIVGCGEKIDEIIGLPTDDCSCTAYLDWPTSCDNDPDGNSTKTEQWNKKNGKSCSESKPSGIYCCGTIEESSIEKSFFDTFANNTFSSRTILVATIGDGFDLIDDDILTNAHNCLTACNDPESSLCYTIKQGAATTQMNAINYLHDELKGGAKSIQKEKIMDLFDQDEDPCMRSDLDISDGKLSNSGKSCSAVTQINLSSTKVLDFTISMKDKVSGAIEETTGNVTSLVFDKRSESMKLTIGNTFLNNDFGGHIHSISKTPNKVIIETDNGCILF